MPNSRRRLPTVWLSTPNSPPGGDHERERAEDEAQRRHRARLCQFLAIDRREMAESVNPQGRGGA
jgi:hypothetical protein